MELSVPYELIGPDATRIVIGGTGADKADPDWLGWLDPEQAIAGLDSPEVREVSQEIVQGHGGLHLDFLHGRRPIVINGVIDPNLGTMAAIVAVENKVKRATNAMSGDALLKWTNSGMVKRRLRLRRQQPPRITGRRPKVFQAPMVDADYRILSDAELSHPALARNVSRIVQPAGDVVATPRFELVGPLGATIRIRNITLGLEVRFKPAFSLAAGEVLAFSTAPPYPVITVNGVSAYGEVDWLPSRLWGIAAGIAQEIVVEAGSGLGTWAPAWRDAWI